MNGLKRWEGGRRANILMERKTLLDNILMETHENEMKCGKSEINKRQCGGLKSTGNHARALVEMRSISVLTNKLAGCN